jgi:hypothetical protein
MMPQDPNPQPPPDDPVATAAAGRRAFLRTAAWGGGIVGIGGLAGLAVRHFTQRQSPPVAPKPVLGQEFTYDVARFQSSDPALLRYEEISRFPVTGLKRARNLAVAPDGAIFVCGHGGIRKFSAAGQLVLTIPLDPEVHALALRPSGEILAGQAGQISIFKPDGSLAARWTDLPDGFLPTAIALTRDMVFIADAGNRVVLKFNAEGKKLGVIGARDAARNIRGFVVPSAYFCVRMAPDGLLRVANPGEHRIEAYTLEGDLEVSWGKGSFAVEGFCGCCNPVSFDIFPDGSFVTCEKGLPRVKLYNSQGEFAGLVAGPEAFPEYLKAANAGTPDALGSGIYAVIDPLGRVLILDGVGATVRIMKLKKTPAP